MNLLPSSADVVVVGAGIVGLAHAYEAWLQGASVVVVDRAAAATGASVRNFGHACLTPQTGAAAGYADVARTRWLDLAAKGGFFARESGTTVVARRPEEMQVLAEFAQGRDDVAMLGADEVRARTGGAGAGTIGGAFMARDLQVDPREAAPAIARWLESVGVVFSWRTAALGVGSGLVRTSRGDIDASRIVVAIGHDVDHLYPELAERHGLVRCHLHMLRIAPGAVRIETPVFTGWSLLRYSGFQACPSSPALRQRLSDELPEGIELDLNQMYTSPPDGSLIVGDTHERSVAEQPFQSRRGFDLLLEETGSLFDGAELRVVEQWQGIYASSPDHEFLIEEPEPDVHVVTVTTGIGMTTALGIAPSVLSGSAVPA